MEVATEARSEVQPITRFAPEELKLVAMRQSWRSLTFLHWRYPPDQVRPLLPASLELDTFDGSAWVGLVPFVVHNFPAVPQFPETNVRTYVIDPHGRRAVWFFSLDADRFPAVIGARIAYGLPYFWASMQVIEQPGKVDYQSRRRWPQAPHSSRISVETGELIRAEELTERDDFLTARYRLCAVRFGQLVYAQIEHPPWPLTRCRVGEITGTLVEAAGLPAPEGAPLPHFSHDQHVKIGAPKAYA